MASNYDIFMTCVLYIVTGRLEVVCFKWKRAYGVICNQKMLNKMKGIVLLNRYETSNTMWWYILDNKGTTWRKSWDSRDDDSKMDV